MARTLLIGLCIFAILNLHDAQAKPALRNRRYVENDRDDYNIGEVESDDLQETRRIRADTTYPPFAGGDDPWWYQESSEEGTTPPVAPSTEGSVKNEGEEESEEKFHKKIVPWFKKQWGHTKNFLKKSYETVKNSSLMDGPM